MMPAVLGVAALSKFLFEYHDSIYYLGGFVMILSAVITFRAEISNAPITRR